MQNAIDGGAKNGYVAGYRVGGKTGTTEKIGSSGAGGMDYISSFCGFAPADNPQYILLIYYDTPKGPSHYGAAVAGPTFRQVMEDALPYLGVERKYTEEELAKLDMQVPFLVGSSVEQAKDKAISLQLNPIVYGSGDTVISQIPDVSTKMPKGGTIVLYTDKDSTAKKAVVPRFEGLSLAAANREASAARVNITIKGASLSSAGSVCVSQSMPEGKEVSPGTVVTLVFSQKKSEQSE